MPENKKKPIVVNDKNDPRLKAYNDSLYAFKYGENRFNIMNKYAGKKYEDINNGKTNGHLLIDELVHYWNTNKDPNEKLNPIDTKYLSSLSDKPGNLNPFPFEWSKRNPIAQTPIYKKPVQPVILEDKPKLEPIKPLGIKTMSTSVEPKLAGNVEVPEIPKTNNKIQNYTAAEALQIQGKPSGYINEGDGTGRKEIKRNGGWLDSLDKGTQSPDNTRVSKTIFANGGRLDKNQKTDTGNANDPSIKEIDAWEKKYTNSLRFTELSKKQGDSPEMTKKRIGEINNFNINKDIITIKDGSPNVNSDKNGKVKYYLNNDKGDWNKWSDVHAHEFGHIPYNDGDMDFPKEIKNKIISSNKEYIKKNISGVSNENIDHDVSPNEVRADKNQLLFQLQKAGIYDATKDGDIKQEQLDKFKKSNDWNRLQRLYDDKDILWLINNVAYNSTESNNQATQLKFGGWLDSLPKQKFDMGGTIDEGESGDILPSWDKVKATLNPYNWGVDDYTKSGTRNQAFNAARKAGEKEFMWNNQRYNTRKDTDPIPYIGNNPNQQEYDTFMRQNYPEFFKTLNRGKNVGSITWKGVSDEQPNRASINTNQTNSNINVGKNPETGHRFIANMIAESGHLKDPKLVENIFNAYDWKTKYEYIKHGEKKYGIPGTTEYDDHRLIEPGMAMIAYGNLSPNNIKKIQKNLGVKDDGYFGPDTYKAMQSKYASNLNVKAALLEHKLRYQDDDKNPISFGDDVNLVKAYLREIESEVPFKNSGRLANKLTVSKDYTDNGLNNIIPGSGDYNVNKLQTTLVNKGYQLPKSTTKDGKLDGIWGDETKQALLDYQSKNAKSKLKNGGWLNNLSTNKFDMGGVLDGLDKGTQVPDATATAKPVVNLNFAVTPAQKQLAAKNKRQAEVDMQVDHPEFYGNQNPLDKKAVKPYSVEDYKKGIKEPGLQTSMDPIDLVGTGVYKGLAKALGAKEVAQGLTKGIKSSKQSIDFSKYLTQEEAVAARANRLISQKNKTGWDEQLTPELEQRLSTAVERHNPASDYPGEKLGSNTMGRTATEISKDANLKGVPLNEANKARVAAHETGHYYSNSPAEGEEWLSHFNLDKLPYKTKVYLRGKHRSSNYANEIRERAAQLKDYIAQKNGIPLNQDFEITQVQLDDAIKNYVKNTGLDNTMSPMLNSLKNKKGLLKTMNKRPLGIVPLTIGTTALQQDKKSQGGWLDNLK